METISVSVEFLASVLGTEAGVLTGKLGDDQKKNEDFLKTEITAKLDKAKRAGKDESFGRAKRETAEEIEKKVAEKFGVDLGTIDEMIERYVENNKKTFKANPNDIRSSDIYVEDLKAERKRIQELEDSYKTKLANVERERVRDVIEQRAAQLLADGGYILPEDKEKRERQTKMLLREALDGDAQFKLLDGKKIQLVDKEGNVMRNDLLDELDFDSYFNKLASSTFDVSKDPGKETPGNKTTPEKKDIKIPTYTNEEEYMNLLWTEKDPAVREALKQDWESKQKK